AEVEDRVHHPRHRDRRTGADRDEQRVARIAEALARLVLQCAQMPLDLGLEAFGELLAVLHVRAARIGGDGEAGRDGDAELRHLGKAHALAAEQLPPDRKSTRLNSSHRTISYAVFCLKKKKKKKTKITKYKNKTSN